MIFRFQSSRQAQWLTALICVIFVTAVITHAPISAAPSKERAYYVQYGPGNKLSAIAQVEAEGGRIDHDLSRWHMLAVSMPFNAVNRLNSTPSIVFSEPVPIYEPAGEEYPFGLDNVQALDVWDFDRDGVLDPEAPIGAGIKVCIIDTGVLDTHKDLAATQISGLSMIVGEAWNETSSGHGTHVAGIVAANVQGSGLAGVAPGVDLFIVKILNNGGSWVEGQSNMGLAAMSCVNNGADIISISLKGTYSRAEELIFTDIYDRYGVLTVAAAANDGNSTGSEDIYNYPASYESVISVGATTSALTHAPYSNENDQVELVAPGSGVMSTWTVPENGSIPFGRVVDDQSVHIGTYLMRSSPGTTTGTLIDGGLCRTADLSVDWNDKIVLCQRSDLFFREIVDNTESQGALATIIIWRDPGLTAGTLGTGTSTGPAVIVTQQSAEILRTKKLGTIVTVETGDGTYPLPGPGGYQKLNGTSMSTPHVAGTAALIWSACPELDNKGLRSVMDTTALDLGDPGRDITYGYGLAQAFAGWHYCQPADLGDSPRSYGQVRHTGLGQLRLGTSWGPDSWQGDYPGPGYDDNDDGIAFSAIVAGSDAQVSVMTSGSGRNPWVYGWLDFNGNGIFEDNEIIVNSQINDNAVTDFSFSVPSQAAATIAFNYRFRLYDVADNPGLLFAQAPTLLHTTISGGEVEDGVTAIPTAVGLEWINASGVKISLIAPLLFFLSALLLVTIVLLYHRLSFRRQN